LVDKVQLWREVPPLYRILATLCMGYCQIWEQHAHAKIRIYVL